MTRRTAAAPRKNRSTANRRLLMAVLAMWQAEGYLQANPIGGQVVAGQAELRVEGNKLVVLQQGERAILNWQDFSIAPGEVTQFLQPGASSAVLNRVVGGKLSELYGTLEANGKVYLINPNGIVVGPTGVVNTAGFVASTLDVTNQEFLAGGDMTFRGNSTAKVVNMGKIGATESDVILIAQEVQNTGQISAPNGTAALAAGQEVLVKASGAERVFVQAGKGSVQNSGTIDAAAAELKAAGGNEYALAINNTGTVRAKGVVNQGGRILLKANTGTARNAGKLAARSSAPRGTGTAQAKVEVFGGKVELTDSSRIEALGGGFVETSGQELAIAPGALVDTRAEDGTLGDWLIDPTDMEILNSGGASLTGAFVSPVAIVAALDVTNVTLQATNSITVTDAINASGNSTAGNLRLEAPILRLNAPITLRTGGVLSGTGTAVSVGANGGVQNGIDAAAAGGTVSLAGVTYALPATLSIAKNLTLQGEAGATVLSGQSARRVLTTTGGTVVAEGLTFTNGSAVEGGGIYVGSGNFTLRNSRVTNNRSTNSAGSGLFGGGMLVNSGTTVLVDRSTISGNTARFGGAIDNYGTLAIANSTVANNTSSSSGGVYNNPGANLTVNNSTVAFNTSNGFGSGLDNDGGNLTVTNSTIVGNTGANGAGIYSGGGTLTLGNVLMYGNSATGIGPNIRVQSSATTSLGYNLYGASDTFTGNGTTDRVYTGTLASLVQTNGSGGAVLADNGGPTQTVALVVGSAALWSGGPNGSGLLDQRGVARGSTLSIGAYDANSATLSHVVTTTADNNVVGSAANSLRSAMWAVSNGYGTGTAVTFDEAGAFATARTITLELGQLTIGTNMTISGPQVGVTIDANQLSRVLRVTGGTVTLDRLTLTGGRTAAAGGGIEHSGGSLTLNDSTIRGNASTGSAGGGIYSYGSVLTLNGSTFSDNSAFNYGGGLEISQGQLLTVQNSTFANNTAQYGGGLDIDTTPSTISNSTISGNVAVGDSRGGGVFNYNSTVTVTSSIIAGNTADLFEDVGNSYVDGGFNLIGIADPVYSGFNAPTTQAGTVASPLTAGLAPLGNYGGLTQTMALLPGSLALNAGSGSTADQRGANRVGAADVGAFESQGFTYSIMGGSNQSAELNQAFASPLVVEVTANSVLEPVVGGVVNLTLPSTGASATGTLTQTIDSLGRASFTLTANTTRGDYQAVVANDGTTAFSLTNAPISLYVTANGGQGKTYGETDPTLTYSFTGSFLPGDSFSGLLGRDTGENVGNYNITLGTLDAGDDYSIVYQGETFSITPRALTVTAGSGSSTYGNSATNPGISVTGGSLANGDTLASLGLGNDFAITNLTNAGSYNIQVTGDAGANYDLTMVSGLWTVGARALTVTAGSGSSTYGNIVANPGISVTGGSLANGDTLASLGLGSDFAITNLTNAGSYNIQVTGDAGANYDLTTVSGLWTVGARAITVTAGSGSSTYGQSATNPGISLTGGSLANGETLASLGLGNDFAITNLTNAGTYTIQVTGDAGTNYDVTRVSGLWTVGARAITITAGSGNSTYGSAAVNPGISLTGGTLAAGDTLASLGLGNDFAITNRTNAGRYNIQVTGSSSADYNITMVDGTWTVVPRRIVVKASGGGEKIAGGKDPEFNYEVSGGGLVNGDVLTGELGREDGEDPGSYRILQGSLEGDGNYLISFQPATFTILPDEAQNRPAVIPVFPDLGAQLALGQMETPEDVRRRERRVARVRPAQVFHFQGWKKPANVIDAESSFSVEQ